MNTRVLVALRKVAAENEKAPWWSATVDGISNWFGKNPRWGSAAAFGLPAFAGGTLLAAVLGAKNPLLAGLLFGTGGAAYGYNKKAVDNKATELWDAFKGWRLGGDKANG